jgi:hypothetical protein
MLIFGDFYLLFNIGNFQKSKYCVRNSNYDSELWFNVQSKITI